MDKSNFSVEDFVLDSEFRDWILYPNNKRNLYWEGYISKNPQSIATIETARAIVLNMPTQNYCIDAQKADKLWENIDRQLDQSVHEVESKSLPIRPEAIIRRHALKKGNSSVSINFQVVKVAALFLLALALGVLYYTLPEPEVEAEINWLTFSTKPGVKSAVTLSDGTVVKLNSASSIRYVQNFVGETREVYLEGEAFFEVAHDAIKPFVVHTKDITTRAIGTSFNINSAAGEKIIISLITGKVEVKSQDVSEFTDYLIPGEQIHTYAAGKSWEKGSFDESVILAWLDQTIIFDNTPLPEAFQILEKWFGVSITLNNFKDQNLTLSGKYKGETLMNILEGLSYTARFKYEINGKNIQINFKQ